MHGITCCTSRLCRWHWFITRSLVGTHYLYKNNIVWHCYWYLNGKSVHLRPDAACTSSVTVLVQFIWLNLISQFLQNNTKISIAEYCLYIVTLTLFTLWSMMGIVIYLWCWYIHAIGGFFFWKKLNIHRLHLIKFNQGDTLYQYHCDANVPIGINMYVCKML